MVSANDSSTPRRGAKPRGVALEARPGDIVTIHYTSRNSEGGVFETSQNRRPLQFVAGKDPIIPGVAEAVIGMTPGEKKTIEIPPERAFGHRDQSFEQVVPRSSLPENLEEGDQLTVVIGDREMDVWVRNLDSINATLDANHPLAGESLVLDIELVTLDRPGR